MSGYHILIPARLESTRLPEKALADLLGKPMIVRVYERACQCGALSVHVATDSERIADAVRANGGRFVMTASNHDSGTSRLAEAAASLGFKSDDIVVNVQGDEPAIPIECIDQVATLLDQHPDARIATLWSEIESREQWQDPDVVKLVTDDKGRALYFSRAPIPVQRDGDWSASLARRHVGLYSYRVAALAEWSSLPDSPLARAESLEQLRAMTAGWTIACARAVCPIPPGIDTPRDLEAARNAWPDMGRRTAEDTDF